ncbi:MAG: hypothetical protein V2I54_03595 [Bacteroidales bacterium]|jgi:hypothetical protein|nr:hypothetical protein [Bacteroidales bacterium]
MKKVLIFMFIISVFTACENCEDATLRVTNPYDHSAKFTTSYTGTEIIAPGETVSFTKNFVTEFTWEATWTVYQDDGSSDLYRGMGQIELGCGDERALTLRYDFVTK